MLATCLHGTKKNLPTKYHITSQIKFNSLTIYLFLIVVIFSEVPIKEVLYLSKNWCIYTKNTVVIKTLYKIVTLHKPHPLFMWSTYF